MKLPDPYAEWSQAELKAHCRELVGMIMRQQNIILNLAAGGMEALNDAGRAEVERLKAAYSD